LIGLVWLNGLIELNHKCLFHLHSFSSSTLFLLTLCAMLHEL
jgi:hypothetical protein